MLNKFLKKEGLTGFNFLNVFLWIKVFWKHNVIQFLLVGGSGVLLQLIVTWLLTSFVFGLEKYYIGYTFGLSLNLIYNFILHTFFTFKAKNGHGRRFIGFIVYSLFMAMLQYLIVRGLVYLFGNSWYLVVISGVILICSIITFIIFKFWLFRE